MTGATLPLHPIAATRGRASPLARLLPLLAGVVVFAVGALIVDGFPVGAIRDDSMYVLLAKSLATGHGYSWLHIPGAPPATHFPPGYPAVLAVLWWLFPSFPANVIVFKLANVLFSAVAAFVVARFVAERFGMSDVGAQAFGIAALVGAPTLALTVQVMSEPLFLAMLVPALLLAERIADLPGARLREIVILGVLAGAATLVRTNGIALIAAVALHLCVRRRFRDAAVFAGVAVALLVPWQLWVTANAGLVPLPMRGNYESYGAWLTSGLRAEGAGLLARTALRTTGELALMFQHVVAPSLPAVARVVALVALVALSAVGARVLGRRARTTAVFLALYSVIVVFWPYTPGRFVWCVWPFVLLLPVLGARELLGWRPSIPRVRAARIAALVTTALLASGYAAYNVKGYRGRLWSSGRYAEYLRPLLVWIATRTRADAFIASEAEGTVYLYSGRHTVPVGSFAVSDYFRSRTPGENAAIMRVIVAHYHPSAVVVSAPHFRAAVRELATSQPPLLTVVDTFPGGGVVLVPTSR